MRKAGANVILEAGTYIVCDWQAGRKTTVTTVDGTQIQSVNRFRVDNNSSFAPVCTVPVTVKAQRFSRPLDTAVNFSKHNVIAGAFVSRGPPSLGNDNDLTGTFDGPIKRSLTNVRIHPCPGSG